MPKLVMYYPDNGEITEGDLPKIADQLRPLIAAAVSTDESPLEVKHVDFVPMPYGMGTVFLQALAFEPYTLGIDSRRAKLDAAVLLELKDEICGVMSPYIEVDSDESLLWLMFVSGAHV